MQRRRDPSIGLERLLEELALRFEYDARGRIVAASTDGCCPRFVLARAAEGCAWRVAADLPEAVVARVARLAGRELALGPTSPGTAPPPERLEMIRRILLEDPGPDGEGGEDVHALGIRRETIGTGAETIGELWQIAREQG